jgi:hypothetical protein
MRDLLAGSARLDVMHLAGTPKFKDTSGNLATVYSNEINKILKSENALSTAFPWPTASMTLFRLDLP